MILTKMVYYLVLLGLGVFISFSVIKLLGLNLNIFKQPDCNYNCICESFEENGSCDDCAYNFSDFDCPLEEVQYAVRNLCNYAMCISLCELYWKNMTYYYGLDNQTFEDYLKKYNNSYCCLVIDLPNFLKDEGYYCGKDYRVYER